MAPLRIGVIGAGLIGRRHLTVLLSDEAYAVGGIADPVPAAANLARQHDLPYYADYRRMLVDASVDGVIVATPNQLHASEAEALCSSPQYACSITTLLGLPRSA